MFYFSYVGNKRTEIKHMENYIIDLIENGKINKIIEPFCGSCSFSFHFYKKYGNKLEYYLSDTDTELIRFLEDIKGQQTSKHYFDYLNETCKDLTKEKHSEIINKGKPGNLKDWVFYRKVFGYRIGLFPKNRKFGNYDHQKYLELDSFFSSENTHIFNKNYSVLFEKFKDDDKALFFLDPPYFDSSNEYYSCFSGKKVDSENVVVDNTTMYEDIFNLFNKKSKVIMVMNDISIIRCLYRDFYKFSYPKNYAITHKKTYHAVFYN